MHSWWSPEDGHNYAHLVPFAEVVASDTSWVCNAYIKLYVNML